MKSTITADCFRCGLPLADFVRANTKYHPECKRRKDRHKSRAKRRAKGDRYFYGLDGELGLNSEGREVYSLLGLGNDDSYHYVYNSEGLGWESIFEFLWSCFERDHREHTVYAGFFLRFDFSQWFKTWPENKARSLFTTSGVAQRKIAGGVFTRPVAIKGRHSTWLVNGIGERLIRIQKKGSNLRRYMAINDAGPFFQTSLLKVIDPKDWNEPVVSDKEFSIISEGKSSRGSYDLSPLQEREYNRLENAALSRVLSRYNVGLSEMGIHLGVHQWYGPGQAAQEWFKNIGLPDKDTFQQVLGPMWDVCIESYYGGWFETFIHGRIRGTVYEYDINSAYPSIMRSLPCILHPTWRTGTSLPNPDEFSYLLVRAKVKGKSPYIGAMLHRISRGSNISRPRNTAGVYWWHELVAAQKAGCIDKIEVEEWYGFKQKCDCPPPLREVADLYEERLRVGKNSVLGKAAKLIYNSAYGKLAQSVGGAKYANPMYASLITAGCRVKILDAIASHPDGLPNVCMVATDAVFFYKPHPDLPLSKTLGEWAMETKENLTIFKPGHYWDEKVRKDLEKGLAPQFKARGVNARDFADSIKIVDRRFGILLLGTAARIHNETDTVPHHLWPSVTYVASFSVVTIGQALAWNDWKRCGEISHDTEVGPIDSDPFRKRNSEKVFFDNRYGRRKGFLRTTTYERAWNGSYFEDESTPYDKRFGAERETSWEGATVITPDGDMGTLILNAIGQGK